MLAQLSIKKFYNPGVWSMASNLVLHCLLRPVCPSTKGNYGT